MSTPRRNFKYAFVYVDPYLLAITIIIITIAWLISCVAVLSFLAVIVINIDMDLQDLLDLARVLVKVEVNPLLILITQLQPDEAGSGVIARPWETAQCTNFAALACGWGFYRISWPFYQILVADNSTPRLPPSCTLAPFVVL